MESEFKRALYAVVGFFGGALFVSRLISNELIVLVAGLALGVLGYYLASIST